MDHQLLNSEPLGAIQSPQSASLSPPPCKQPSPYMPSPGSSLPVPHPSASPAPGLPPAVPMSSINSFPPPHPPGPTFSIPSATPLSAVNMSTASPAVPSFSDATLSFPANPGPVSVPAFSCTPNSAPVSVPTFSCTPNSAPVSVPTFSCTPNSVPVSVPTFSCTPNSVPVSVPTFSCPPNSVPVSVCTSGPAHPSVSVAAPPVVSLNCSTDPPLRFTFDELNLPDLYASFKSLVKTMRERGGSQSDVPPLAVLSNDTTPLHTPTLLPMSPHPAPPAPPAHPPETERVSQYTVPADWFSNPDSLKESFRIASSLNWANIDLSGHPDLLESMRQAELCDWALDPALFTSLCDSLNRFFTQRGMINSGSNSPLALGAPHSLQVPQFPSNPPPTLASLTHPSPLPSYSPVGPTGIGAQPPRRPMHMPGQGFQRPQLTQPATTAAGMQPQSMTPRQRPPLKSLHSNSEEIQDDFDWDSLLV